jgi:hypothetical protein
LLLQIAQRGSTRASHRINLGFVGAELFHVGGRLLGADPIVIGQHDAVGNSAT